MPESISKFKGETFRVTVRSAGRPDGSAFYEPFTGCSSLLLAENVPLPATHQSLRWAGIRNVLIVVCQQKVTAPHLMPTVVPQMGCGKRRNFIQVNNLEMQRDTASGGNQKCTPLRQM